MNNYLTKSAARTERRSSGRDDNVLWISEDGKGSVKMAGNTKAGVLSSEIDKHIIHFLMSHDALSLSAVGR
ncbi:hypothetical protein C1H46_025249 [Malus baccata]|uniref:Uncharacterized protein n=1 Tax=Malus baccata TaxID=106549 RepID=A0A540LRS0_MALBA|nr:hypothetical protein C1H46_025249 [Malus baccata]